MKLLNFLKRNFFTVAMVTVAFVIAIVMAYWLITQTIHRLQNEAQTRLEKDLNTIVNLSNEHFNSGFLLLKATRGYWAGSDNISRFDFDSFAKSSRFFIHYPEFSTLAFIERVPDAQKATYIRDNKNSSGAHESSYPNFSITPDGIRDEYWPITYIYPEPENKFLLGVDQHVETARSQNIERARDTGDPSVSQAINLLQGKKGVILAIPLYRGDKIPLTLQERQNSFIGALTATFIADDFYDLILTRSAIDSKKINLSVTDQHDSLFSYLNNTEIADDFFDLYGEVHAQTTLNVKDSNLYSFNISANTSSYLSDEEKREPFFLGAFFALSAIFMSIIILLSQKGKAYSDIKKRYTFIATLSHQIRTPITNLRWGLESLDVSKKNQTDKKILFDNVLALNSMMEKMILYIEMSDDAKKTRITEIISTELLTKKIDNIISTLKQGSRIQRIGKKRFTGKLSVNSEKILLAISYIFENALIYTPEKKKITLEYSQSNNLFTIIISDHGIGIPHSEQTKVFTPFFRATNASLGINYGSGVSLFMANEIIKCHDGSISFTSSETNGSTFTISLPIIT